ncbi:MAG TPA: DeoR/GlpR family DNA-binding transcription regulator [Acidimicrobiales bacterium]|jgi:DeoR family fructose operon transcriptional repressor|nr:DeoR/GlpR family DNA-binding transcription regulator [Acidimicrobiales bacterium]
MGMTGNLATEERLAWLRARLEGDGRIRISDAARDLAVSEMTVRRDLQELEAVGQARRVRGGAVSIGPLATGERSRERGRAKARIASKLLPLVSEVGAMGMDASSTVCRVAAMLDSARDLTIVTNGPETFQTLHGRPGINPLLTGGRLDVRTGSLVGPLAVATASQVLLGGLLMSAAAVDPDLGPSEVSIEEAEVKRSLASVAEMVILAVDSTKLGERAIAVSIGWEHVTTLVTDLDPADVRLDPFRDRVAIL